MIEKSGNDNLLKAKREKNDEFYTMYEDIEKELQHYTESLEGKSIYCNCDSPESNFVKYFKDNYERLNLTGLTATGYRKGGNGIYYHYDGEVEYTYPLECNGSFNSNACVEILGKCDIVVTNPPFSIYSRYINILLDIHVKFLIVGTCLKAAIPRLEQAIVEDKVDTGYNRLGGFLTEQGIRKIGTSCWWTNLETVQKPILNNIDPVLSHKSVVNTDVEVLFVEKSKYIPSDYSGFMAVPTSFLLKRNSSQFKFFGISQISSLNENPLGIKKQLTKSVKGKMTKGGEGGLKRGVIVVDDGERVYAPFSRIVIKRRSK